MANPEHVELLKQRVTAWNQWREENLDVKPNLSRANLESVDLRGANLYRADLSGANLWGADLFVANLRGADLRRADLRGADLFRVYLSGADLRGANLLETRLLEADLRGANLRGAYLRWAYMVGADLYDADLAESICGNTNFANVDLSEAKGLKAITHHGPSTIGIDTLIKSKGKIPEVFLRGCGAPEEFIIYMPSLVGGSAIQYYSCFISYSHADKAFARRVHDTLQARGIRRWLDEKQILPGQDILTEVDRGIKLWDKVLLCASRESLHSGWVDTELTKALEKERELTKERSQRVFALIPLDIDGYLLSKDYQSPIKSEIVRRSVPEFKGWDGHGGNAIFEREMERVFKALRTDEGRELPPPTRL